MYAGDEEVRAWVASVCFAIILATIRRRATPVLVSHQNYFLQTISQHTESPYDHLVMRFYHGPRDSCRHASQSIRPHAWLDEARHFGHAHHAHSEAHLRLTLVT